MNKAIRQIGAWVDDEDGATAVEYGIMAALIAGAIIVTVTTLGTKVMGLWTKVETPFPN